MDDLPVPLAAGKCLDLFESAVQDAREFETTHNTQPEEFEPNYSTLAIEKDRYQIWAANASAFAQGRSSLENRLRQLPEQLELVKSLLDTIRYRLELCISATREAHGNISPDTMMDIDHSILGTGDTDTDSESTEDDRFNFAKALESIHISIDLLHQLSSLFRKPSVINQNIHAQSRKLPGIDADGLGAFFTRIVGRDFPGLSEQLKSRMSRTMAERHRRILYRRSRYGSGWKQQAEYQQNSKPSSAQINELELPPEKEQIPIANSLKRTEAIAAPNPAEHAPSLLSKTSVTEPDRSRYYTPSAISTAKSAAPSHDLEDLVPPAPTSCKNQTSFICQLCCMILPIEIGTGDSWWNHVRQDLDCYVCLFEICDDPFNLFSTRNEWLHHMRNEHLVKWTCPLEEEEVVRLDTEEELIKHMKKLHMNVIEPDMVPSITVACRQTSEVVFETCPFCTQVPEQNIQEHITHHLRYLALKSIPWQDNEDQNDNKSENNEFKDDEDDELSRETLSQATSALKHGSISTRGSMGFFQPEYGENFCTSEEQRKSSRPEWVDGPSHDRYVEWGFIDKITIQHVQWREIIANELQKDDSAMEIDETPEQERLSEDADLQMAEADYGELQAGIPKRHAVDEWINSMDRLNRILEPGPDDLGTTYRPARIAILSTGITPHAAEWIQRRDGIIADVENFTERPRAEQAFRELGGIGSYIAMTIVRVAPRAALYIARVMSDDEVLYGDAAEHTFLLGDTDKARRERTHINNALNWCISQHVDIVVISVPLNRLDCGITAISTATNAGILCLAPSSRGDVETISNTASMQVMGVFSADADGSPTHYNPLPHQPDSRRELNFAFLGECVLEPTLSLHGISGLDNFQGMLTSTAIAAGFTGALLDFLRQRVCRDTIGNRRVAVNRLVDFYKPLSEQHGRYYCVDPSQLLNGTWRQGGIWDSYEPRSQLAVGLYRTLDYLNILKSTGGGLELNLEPGSRREFQAAYEAAIGGSSRAWRCGDLLTVEALYVMKRAYMKLKRYEDAGGLLEYAVKGFKRSHRERESGVIRSNPAIERMCRAERLLAEAIETFTREFGAKHPSTFDAIYSLAEIYKYQERHADAKALLRDAIRRYEEAGEWPLRRTKAVQLLAEIIKGQGGSFLLDMGVSATGLVPSETASDKTPLFGEAAVNFRSEPRQGGRQESNTETQNAREEIYSEDGKLPEKEDQLETAAEGNNRVFTQIIHDLDMWPTDRNADAIFSSAATISNPEVDIMPEKKCWFVLNRTDIRAPDVERMGDSAQAGELSLGHLLLSLSSLASPIPDSFLPLGEDILSGRRAVEERYQGTLVRATCTQPAKRAKSTIEMPVPSMETYTFKPTPEYVRRNMRHLVDMTSYGRRTRNLGCVWSVYMVTGLKIARSVRYGPVEPEATVLPDFVFAVRLLKINSDENGPLSFKMVVNGADL